LVIGSFLFLSALFLQKVTSPPIPTKRAPLLFYSSHTNDDLKKIVCLFLKTADRSCFLSSYGFSDEQLLSQINHLQGQNIQVTVYDDIKLNQQKKFSPSITLHKEKHRGLMHRKFLIVDEHLLLFSSINMTRASLTLHENIALGFDNQKFASALIEKKSYQEPLFSYFPLPDHGTQALKVLCLTLQQAKEKIQLAIFTLTHPQIVDELIFAQKRGVAVTVYIDRYQAAGASKAAVQALLAANICVKVPISSNLLHHKCARIDGKTLIIGSANWTQAAFTKNAEDLLILSPLPPQGDKFFTKFWRRVDQITKLW